jgi:hypothetical protein
MQTTQLNRLMRLQPPLQLPRLLLKRLLLLQQQRMLLHPLHRLHPPNLN